MDQSRFLSRFDGQSKLLLRALLSGASGPFRALDVFYRLQRTSEMSLCRFIQTLCQEEINWRETEVQPLTVCPLVCLFPALFSQNLLSFIHLVQPLLPQPTVLHLIKCISKVLHPSPWVTALVKQLKRNMGVHNKESLYTSQCSHRLKELSQRLVGCHHDAGGWAKCFSSQTAGSESQKAFGLSELGSQRKRKESFVSLDSDGEETGSQRKRMKMEVCISECPETEVKSLKEESSERSESDVPSETPAKEPEQMTDVRDALPEHIKVTVLQIKELLEGQAEWDQSSMDVFKVLNECDPGQVELLCSMLSFPDLPEQTLPRLCSSISAPSLDISFSTATALIRSLLLEKVLSLSEPASRCLVNAVTSLCSHYPRPMCHALIEPVLQDTNIGNPQAELLNRLIEGCIDSHYKLLVLQMTFKIVWSEAVLSIIHSLLDSKLDLSEELLTQFTEQLVSQGPQFTKSVKFAKMMLTVLTKYCSNVNAAHKHSLSGCLMLNETFLKKPLQAALKRISD